MNRIQHIIAVVLLFGWFILHGSTALSQTDQKISDSPRDLALRFLKLDFEGARLSSDTYNKSGIREFIVSGEYKSPGWDIAILVKGYKIQKANQTGKTASVTVKYDVIGSVSSDVALNREKETYAFRFKRQNNRWVMIEPYDLPPHISIGTAVRDQEQLDKLQGEVDLSRKVVLTKLKKLQEGRLSGQDSFPWRFPLIVDLGSDFEWRKKDPELYLDAKADFNGDGREDVAGLLVNDKENQLGLFVALTSQKDASPMLVETIKDKKSMLSTGVRVAKPGRYQTACGKGHWPCGKDEPAVIEIEHPAIDLFQSEGANSFFIWDDKTQRMKRIWMSD